MILLGAAVEAAVVWGAASVVEAASVARAATAVQVEVTAAPAAVVMRGANIG